MNDLISDILNALCWCSAGEFFGEHLGENCGCDVAFEVEYWLLPLLIHGNGDVLEEVEVVYAAAVAPGALRAPCAAFMDAEARQAHAAAEAAVVAFACALPAYKLRPHWGQRSRLSQQFPGRRPQYRMAQIHI